MKLLRWLLLFPIMLFIDDPGGGAGPQGGGAGGGGPQAIPPEALKAAGIETTAEGLRYQIDPNDPNSTVYVGKDYTELMNNVRSGISAKDRYISDLKSAEGPDDGDTFTPPAAPQPTDMKVLLDAAAQRYGVNREMFDYTDEQWKDYEMRVGAVVATREYMKVEAIRQSLQQEIHDAQESEEVGRINADVIRRETSRVEQLAADYGIKEADFEATYDKVLDEVLEDPKSYVGGVLDTGLIVTRSAIAMRKFLSTSEQTRLEQDLAHQKEQLDRAAAGGGGTGGGGVDTRGAAPKDYDDAVAQARATLKASRGR